LPQFIVAASAGECFGKYPPKTGLGVWLNKPEIAGECWYQLVDDLRQSREK
jgi:hypothetical protein